MIFRRWNGERWIIVGTFMFLVSRRGEDGKRLPRIGRTYASFGIPPAAGDWRRKPKPDGGEIHG